jgi:hypothetical protein
MTDVIYHTTGFANGTAEWTRATNAVSKNARTAYAVWGTSADDVRIGSRSYGSYNPDVGEFVFVGQHTLSRDGDGNVSWKGVAGTGNVLGFWGASANDVWLIADNSESNTWEKGITRHGTPDPDGGTALVWTNVDSQSPMALAGIWGSSADDIWAVGDKGTMRRMKKGMTRWEIVSSPTTEALRAIWGTAANDIWAVGDSGTILHYDGNEWSPSAAAFGLGYKPNLYGVWGSSKDDVWIVGDVTLHYTGPKGGPK